MQYLKGSEHREDAFDSTLAHIFYSYPHILRSFAVQLLCNDTKRSIIQVLLRAYNQPTHLQPMLFTDHSPSLAVRVRNRSCNQPPRYATPNG